MEKDEATPDAKLSNEQAGDNSVNSGKLVRSVTSSPKKITEDLSRKLTMSLKIQEG